MAGSDYVHNELLSGERLVERIRVPIKERSMEE
jgi:hypothetical protein